MATRKPKRAARSVKRATRKTQARRPSRKPAAARRAERRHDPETLRLRAFAPGFTVNDLRRSIAFYTDVLGFIVSERWTHEGELRGVMLRAGVCDLGLSQDDWAKGRERKKGEGVRLYCQTVQDVDALAARIKAAGGRLTEQPQDQPWGARSLAVDDPDGFHITIYREKKK